MIFVGTAFFSMDPEDIIAAEGVVNIKDLERGERYIFYMADAPLGSLAPGPGGKVLCGLLEQVDLDQEQIVELDERAEE